MKDEKLVALLKLVAAKTASGELKWQGTCFDGWYEVVRVDTILRITKTSGGGDLDFEFEIIGEGGKTLESIRSGDLARMVESGGISTFDSKEFMATLLRQARRIAMGTEARIDALLSDLGGARP